MNDATDELLRRVNELEEKLRECAARERSLKEWKEKGDALFSGNTPPMFALGEWWADRPWRKK